MPTRTDIRTALKAVLIATGDYPSGAVHVGKYDPIRKLPAVALVGLEDEIENISMGRPRTRRHELRIKFEIYAQKTAAKAIDERLDDLVDNAEAKLSENTTLSVSGVQDSFVERVTYDLTVESDKPIGAAILEVLILYTDTKG